MRIIASIALALAVLMAASAHVRLCKAAHGAPHSSAPAIMTLDVCNSGSGGALLRAECSITPAPVEAPSISVASLPDPSLITAWYYSDPAATILEEPPRS